MSLDLRNTPNDHSHDFLQYVLNTHKTTTTIGDTGSTYLLPANTHDLK